MTLNSNRLITLPSGLILSIGKKKKSINNYFSYKPSARVGDLLLWLKLLIRLRLLLFDIYQEIIGKQVKQASVLTANGQDTNISSYLQF